MVFPSLPLYLDPPNWHQQGNQQIQGHNNNNHEQNQHHLVPPQPPPQQPTHHMGIGGSRGGGILGAQQIRPNSMAEHARQLKIPPPMGPLKCPRCESTNTKFCYYNNYNLTQPRHLCKTCRRYWTQGGALRNVPVGGGCRKNKRPSHKPSAPSGGPPSSSKLSSTSVGVNINSPINIHSGGANSMSFLTSNLQNIGHLGGTSHMGHLSTFTGGPIQTAPFNTNLQDIIMSGRLEKGGVEADSTHNIGFPQHVVHQFPNFLGGFQIPGSTSAGGLYSGSFQNVRHYGNQGIGDGRDDSNHEQQQQQRQLQLQQQQQQQQQQLQQQQMDDNMAKMNASTNMKLEVKAEVNRQQQGHNLTNEVILSGNTSSADNNVTNTDNNININSNNQFWGGNMMNENVVTSPWTE